MWPGSRREQSGSEGLKGRSHLGEPSRAKLCEKLGKIPSQGTAGAKGLGQERTSLKDKQAP